MRIESIVLGCLLAACAMSSASWAATPDDTPVLHTFYYSWYMNPETDGRWAHWNHNVLLPDGSADSSRPAFPGGGDIGADFYPSLGAYSSADGAVMQAHAKMLTAAGVDNVVLSWWGPDSPDADAVRRFADVLHEHGLTFSIHVEPFYTDVAGFERAISKLGSEFGDHPALYRLRGQPLYFVYDSYRLPVDAWQTVLTNDGDSSLRGTEGDGLFIGLWVEEEHGAELLTAGFDGFYSYFAVDGFVFGSTTDNWPAMARFARASGLLFVPCAGPGYQDTRIRPWNSENYRSRDGGAYFDRMFEAALDTGSPHVAVTSFNEWHEGTQIEPARPARTDGFVYADYAPLDGDYYLHRTRFWKTALENRHD